MHVNQIVAISCAQYDLNTHFKINCMINSFVIHCIKDRGVQGDKYPQIGSIKNNFYYQMLPKHLFLPCIHCLYYFTMQVKNALLFCNHTNFQIKSHDILCLNLDHLLCYIANRLDSILKVLLSKG